MGRTRKTLYGTARADGRIFYQKQNGKERWLTPEQWQRLVVAPAEAKKAATAKRRAERKARQAVEEAERKARWDAKVTYWAATKDEREAAFKEKQKAKIKKLREESPEVLRQREREYFERHKDCPEWRARRKASQDRHKSKQREMNAPAIAARKAEREAKKAKESAEKEERRLAREAAAAERKLVLASKPKVKRVRLTDEQRKESKRAEKRNYKHRRRCRIREQEAKATPLQIRELKKSAKGRCFYCRAKVKMLTLDHIVPIAKGGGHTLDNIVFACHACNSEKRDLDPSEYAQKHGMLLV